MKTADLMLERWKRLEPQSAQGKTAREFIAEENRRAPAGVPAPHESAGAAGMDGVRESGIPQEETLEVVTKDYKTVKVARHVVDNMKERIRKQMGLPEDWRSDEAKILYHRRQLALLEKADAAPRCEHIRADGTRCRGPRVRAGKKCYAHARMDEARPQRLRLPALEDANSVLLAVMEIQRALVDGLISEKTAGLLLYSVQIGAWAVRHATFAETEPEEMVRKAAFSQTRGQIHRGGAEARRTEEQLAVPSVEAVRQDLPAQAEAPAVHTSFLSQSRGEMDQESAPARVPVPHDLPGIHDLLAQPRRASTPVPPPRHAKRMSGTPVPPPRHAKRMSGTPVRVPHDLPGIHDLSTQAGAAAVHNCSSSERRNSGLPEVATARGQEVIPGMNDVSAIISGMKEEG